MPIVLLHGFLESANMWSDLSTRLSKNYRVLCPNLPGFGNTSISNSPISIDSLAVTLKKWLDIHHISKCILMGHSLGGYITLSFAGQFPNYLLGYGLLHSNARADDEERKHNREKLIRFIEKFGVRKFAPDFVHTLFYQKNERIQEIIENLVTDTLPIRDECVINYIQAMKNRVDRTYLLKEKNIPTLFIAGEHDSLIPIDVSLNQSASLNPEFVVTLKNSGHMGMFEEPDLFYNAITAFLLSID
jgi:pimeloyl-ACP methyl ester carboxylesterase